MRDPVTLFIVEAEGAFVQEHSNDYWHDSNDPRRPWGHQQEFSECQHDRCVRQKQLLKEVNAIRPVEWKTPFVPEPTRRERAAALLTETDIDGILAAGDIFDQPD